MALLWLLLLTSACDTSPARQAVYVADLAPTWTVLAWGPMCPDYNSIGRGSRPVGNAVVEIDGRRLEESSRNWLRVEGLKADSVYDYRISVEGGTLGEGRLRTEPTHADQAAFLVIGDYGRGNPEQIELAQAMLDVIDRQDQAGNPVRFILTTGDNIYGRQWGFAVSSSGNDDGDWERKFFLPFRELLKRVPFYPAPGNHDGDDSEKTQDLAVYIDNFFLPPMSSNPGSTARYYSRSYAGLIDFFSLDSTLNSPDPEGPLLRPEGPQHQWFKAALASSKAPWKVVYLHHPFFTAGPHYDPTERIQYLAADIEAGGTDAVFAGHEHNFQASDPAASQGILHVVTGGGSSVRRGAVRHRMAQRGIRLWAAQPHFVLVTLTRSRMTVTPHGRDGRPLRTLDESRGLRARSIHLDRP